MPTSQAVRIRSTNIPKVHRMPGTGICTFISVIPTLSEFQLRKKKQGAAASRTRAHTSAHLHNGITEVLLLAEKDVSSPSNESTDGDIREKVMLLQRHIRQTQISLRITRVRDNIRKVTAEPPLSPSLES